MTVQSRASIIDQIGAKLSAPILAYVTGDRQGMNTQIGDDQPPLFPRHLLSIGKQEKLGLLLYTRGGNTNVPWSIISYVREHCDELTVLVPFCAHSSGTLLALGADWIAMTRFATLSPIDPTVANAFNPQDPANPAARLQISVEDVLAYIELARENVEGDHLGQAFQRLADALHPLALGNVKRSINQIRQLAAKLIELHPPVHTGEELDALVTRLTTQFYSHQHLISRREATEIGLPITAVDDELEQLMLDYYAELQTDMCLLDPFDPPRILAAIPAPAAPVAVTLERAYIETSSTCDAYISRGTVGHQMVPGPAGPQQAVAFEVHSERWEQVV